MKNSQSFIVSWRQNILMAMPSSWRLRLQIFSWRVITSSNGTPNSLLPQFNWWSIHQTRASYNVQGVSTQVTKSVSSSIGQMEIYQRKPFQFEIDKMIENKLLITVAPDRGLKRVGSWGWPRSSNPPFVLLIEAQRRMTKYAQESVLNRDIWIGINLSLALSNFNLPTLPFTLSTFTD